jgi:hypothetical protein
MPHKPVQTNLSIKRVVASPAGAPDQRYSWVPRSSRRGSCTAPTCEL